MTIKISHAQAALIRTIPEEWSTMPILGDSRPRAALIRAGLVETREIDVTPADLGNSMVRVKNLQWRLTELGKSFK